MTDKIKSLLAVLELPENGQKIWLAANDVIRNHEGEYLGDLVLDESLADLAFRLTPQNSDDDEWTDAKILVFEHYNPDEVKFEDYKFRKRSRADNWFMSSEATATDRIIAALIAKEAKEKK